MKLKLLVIGLLIAGITSCNTIDLEELTKVPLEQTEEDLKPVPDVVFLDETETISIIETPIVEAESEEITIVEEETEVDEKENTESVENKNTEEDQPETETEQSETEKEIETVTEKESLVENKATEDVDKEYLIQEELKVQDVADTVIYVERPVYIPEDKEPPVEVKKVTGYEATLESENKSIMKPENYKYGTFIYQYNPDMVYEIYAEPFHLTDIILEPGEVVIGTPLLSEDESVWELTAGVGRDPFTGLDIQHLFIKPAYSKLDSTLIIITDKRTYHLRIKSFLDTHMAMVRFVYPEQRNVWAKKSSNDSAISYKNNFIKTSNPELLSFDYKMSYPIFRKPEFLPKQVYDDGQSTYILVDSIVLQKKLPIIFDEKNEIINYSVKGNMFIVPRLINKVTLKLGKDKITIEKKKTKISNLEG